MYQISQLMSTPVTSKCSSRLDRECAGKLPTTCIFPRFACDFLDGDSSFECCLMDPLTGSHYTCRRSPRLLTNGYYIWTEDSFLCDKDGNITLNPSQTRVMYKENLVRIFRKKRRFRHSLSSLFNISTSEYWLSGSSCSEVDTRLRKGTWLKGVRGLDASHCSENGSNSGCSSLTDEWELEEEPTEESTEASFSGFALSLPPKENSQCSSPWAPWKASGHFQESVLDHPKISLLREVSFQAILLVACFIISVCARWCMGGISASVFTCTSVITIAYVLKSFLLSLVNYFKAITCSWFDKS